MDIYTAFIIGLLGSFHCIGMCGPIALALPLTTSSTISFINGRLLYNFGRIITYGLMGLLFGLIGGGLILAGFQQGLSIALGIIILIMVFIPSKQKIKLTSHPLILKMSAPIKSKISILFKKGTPGSLLLIGLLNGFLPCGFVYAGLAGAMSTGSIISGMLFMVLFGLGTTPAMFAMSVFGKWVSLGIRRKINRAVPVFAVLLAVIFILRGMDLGIPYISPKFNSTAVHGAADCCEPVK